MKHTECRMKNRSAVLPLPLLSFDSSFFILHSALGLALGPRRRRRPGDGGHAAGTHARTGPVHRTDPARPSHLDRESYGFLNLWATLLGGLFCLPCGWLIDRLGTRAMLSGVMIALGVVVVAMSQVQGNDGYR